MRAFHSFLWNFKRLGPVSWTKCALTNVLLVAGEYWRTLRQLIEIRLDAQPSPEAGLSKGSVAPPAASEEGLAGALRSDGAAVTSAAKTLVGP